MTTHVHSCVFARAEALAVELDTVRNCVAAISKIFLDCSKDNLAEKDFAASIASAELPEASVVALASTYKSARAELRERAKSGATQLPSYQGFDWRLDIEMSRRGAHHVAQPLYMLRLDSVQPQAAASSGSGAAEDSVHTESSTAAAGTSSMYLQSDYANLAQLQAALQDALAESSTQHASRVERYIR